MPASLPGDNTLNNFGNPNAGRFVLFDALSGPKGSLKDADGWTLSWDANGHSVYTVGAPQHISTGGLSNGIGFGSPPILTGPAQAFVNGGSVKGYNNGSFTDDYKPGISEVDATDSADSSIMYIGGGRSETIAVSAVGGQDGYVAADPYTAGFGICGAGNGGSRDSGANTGFGLKSVIASGAVANGAVVEAGWINRSGEALVADQAVFGSAVAAMAAPV